MNSTTPLTAATVALLLAACGSEEGNPRLVGELASDRMELAAETDEPIDLILVDEGVEVAAGDALIRQNDERARARLAEADGALAQAVARLDELLRGPRREQIDAARANVEGAERELEFRLSQFRRATDLTEKKLAAPEQLDRATADLEAAKATLDQRKAQLDELLTGTTAEQLAQAEAAVTQARARRDAARIDLERHTIRAPTDGITDVRLFELGERPGPGQAVMVMLGGSQPFARVYVPEALRVHVTTGTAARVYVDGLTAPLEGRVRWVSSEAAFTPYFALTERDRGRLSFVAKVDLPDRRERLPDGVPVEVELLVDTPATGD